MNTVRCEPTGHQEESAVVMAFGDVGSETASEQPSVETRRVALAMVHALCKDVDWITRLVRRIPKVLDDRERALRDLGIAEELSAEVARELRAFATFATDAGARSPATLGSVIEEAIRRVERLHGNGCVTVGASPEAGRSLVSRELLYALVNILDNGVQASERGVAVDLRAIRAGTRLWIAIADSGRGMNREAREQAFRPGVSTKNGRGLGIGLTVTREILASAGGTMHVESAEGVGTTVVIELSGLGRKAPR